MENSTKQDFENSIALIKQERPLFEANHIYHGGDLKYLKWSECSDGTGTYEVDWEAVDAEFKWSDSDDKDAIIVKASILSDQFHTWVQCAKSKAIPHGYYLMPSQPCEEMLKKAELEFQDLDIEDIQDRIVFSHQAMIQVLSNSTR